MFIPVYSRLKVETAYEYLELRFHVAIRILASGLFILLRIGWMASATYAASVVVASVSGIPQNAVIIGLGIVSIGYTMLGGLRAVMWTDVIQFFVFGGTILATLYLILANGNLQVSDVVSTYFDGREGLVIDFKPSMTLKYGSWAILIGVFLEGLSANGADQVAVQRYLSARSERQSQFGAALNLVAMWMVLPGLLAIGVGLYSWFGMHPNELGAEGSLAQVLESDAKAADRAMPEFVRLHFPPGLGGLFLAALMAAIMSSIDSGIHSVSTAVVVDFRDRLFPSWRPADEKGELRAIRILVMVIGAIAVGLACFVGPLGNVFDIGKKLTAAFGGPLLAIFVLAFFSRRVTSLGVMIGILTSTVLTLVLMYKHAEWFLPEGGEWFSVWYWPIGFGVALILAPLFSLGQTESSGTQYTWREVMKISSEGAATPE